MDGSEKFAWEIIAPNLSDSHRIMAIRFDPSGSTLFAFLENVTHSDTDQLKFVQFDIDKREQREFRGVHGVVDGRATGDGKSVITWDGSGDLVYWDLESCKEVATVKAAPNHVFDIAFSPEEFSDQEGAYRVPGDIIATAGDDNEVKFWRTTDRKRLETQHPFLHKGIDLVKLSADGTLLVTGSDDGWIKCWDAPAFCSIRREPLHEAIVESEKHVTKVHFSDGLTRETHNLDGTVIDTYPDGTVRTYKRQ
jgi:WD40 repeat protein